VDEVTARLSAAAAVRAGAVRQAVVMGVLIGVMLALLRIGEHRHHSLLVTVPVLVVICVAVSVSPYWFKESRDKR